MFFPRFGKFSGGGREENAGQKGHFDEEMASLNHEFP